MIRRLVAEPLLHFAVLGAALFGAYRFVAADDLEVSRIVVTAGQIAALEAEFTGARQRPPTDAERQALIDRHIRDEVFYREGVALGLDRDDPVVRNRVKQRMEFVAEDTLSVEPTEADLAAYLAAHPRDFEVPGLVTFDQVYFDPVRHGNRLTGVVTDALDRLRRGEPAPGDRTMLPAGLSDASPRDVSVRFGDTFATAMAALPTGNWEGPVQSSFGLHLVRVTKRAAPSLPALADAREVVAREWARARMVTTRETYYQELRKRYEVTVDAPVPASARAGQP